MTVGELRKALEGVADDMKVLVPDDVFMFWAKSTEIRAVDNNEFMNGVKINYTNHGELYFIISS